MNQAQLQKNIADMESENLHLQDEIAAVAGQIHLSLKAWHQQGISQKTASLFHEIDRWILRAQRRNPGLTERIRSFFAEDDDEIDDSLKSLEVQLKNVQMIITTYRFRMTALAAEHRSVVDRFARFLDELRAKISGSEFQGTPLPRLVANGMEYRAAQEQLARMILLQQTELGALESDIAQVILMTTVLVKNHAAAEHLLKDGRTIIRKYADS